ncbi:MAG: zinc ribbon domain-containing protein, partial [Patescibacteria group bacterium]
ASFDKKHVQYAVKPFTLRGLIRCDKCDGLITPELKKGQYIYYSCTNFKGSCERKWIREEKLLEPIKEMLADMQMPQDRVDKVIAKIKETSEVKNTFHEKAVSQLQTEYTSTQQKLNRLLDLLVDNSITRDEYDVKLKEYKEKQYDIGIRLEEYTRADQNFHLVASMIFSLANRALEIFESSEVPEKRQLLNYLLQNCKLSGTKLRFELKEPFKSIYETKHEPTLLPG